MEITSDGALRVLIFTILIFAAVVIFCIITSLLPQIEDKSYECWKYLHLRYKNSKSPIIIRGVMKILFFIGTIGY